VHKSQLDETQGNFYQQCICCCAPFDGVNTISLLPAAPVPVWTNNIAWAEYDSDKENFNFDEELIDRIQNHDSDNDNDGQAIPILLSQAIGQGNQDMAIHFFRLTSATDPYSNQGIVDLIQMTIKSNCMRVFDHILPSYEDFMHSHVYIAVDVALAERHRAHKLFLSSALSAGSLPSTLLYLIRHRVFLSENVAWATAFEDLFRLPLILPTAADMLLQSELVLSKLKIIVENGANPQMRHYGRHWYSGFDEFTEWCVSHKRN